ncbi:TPA: hypothetical protein PTV29_002189 [Clostridium botulinum]|nr:hypothetical protein [Clostridium botulinum]
MLKYISCYCSTSNALFAAGMSFKFKYILCYCSAWPQNPNYLASDEFKYISCCCSINYKYSIPTKNYYLNTSHVVVQS